MLEAVLSGVIGVVAIARKARAKGIGLLSGPNRRFAFSFAPHAGRGLLPYALYGAGQVHFLPGLWLLPLRGQRLLRRGPLGAHHPGDGVTFLALGALALFARRGLHDVFMGAGFALLIAFGLVIARATEAEQQDWDGKEGLVRARAHSGYAPPAGRRRPSQTDAPPRPRRPASGPGAADAPGVLGAVPALDRLIHERLRLGIVSALAVNESLTFNELKHLLGTTDGNLSVHARKLEGEAVTCSKYFEGRQPRTEYPPHRPAGRPTALPGLHGVPDPARGG